MSQPTRGGSAAVPAALVHTESQLRAILDHAPAAIFVKDLAGRYVLVNHHFGRLFGLEPADVIGRTDPDLLPAATAAAVQANDRRALDAGGELAFDELVPLADGVHTFETTKSPLFAPDGVAYAICGIAYDVTPRRRAEERVRDLAAIVESSDDAIIGHTPEGLVTSWNRAAEQLYGYAAAEVLGRPVFDLAPAERRDELRALFARVAAGAHVDHAACVRLAKDGRRLDVALTLSPIQAADGAVVAIAAIERDVTAERRGAELLRRSERSLANAQRIAHLGNWDWDLASGELAWSDEVYRIFGARPGDFGATYEAFLGFVHPDDRAAVRAAVDVALAGEGTYAIDHRVVRLDGTERVVHEQGEVARDATGRAVGMSGTVLDITELRRAQTTAAARQAELEHARALDAVKGAFLNSVTHELRTPLTALFGYGELLEDEVEGRLTAGQRAFLRRLMACGRQLQRLVDDLLESARMEANTFALRLEAIDPAILGRDAAEALAPLAADADVAVQADLPPEGGAATLDPQRVMQVLTNLVANAIKFSPRGGVVRLRVRTTGAAVRFEVADDGPGIAPEDRPRLFQRFSQLAAGRARGGTGLGPAISRAIVEAHGGRIGVESEPGRGSTFWFELPAAGPG